MELGETPEQAVIREVAEETGLICRPTRLLDAHAVIGGFYGDIVVLGYAADPLEGTVVPGGDADDVAFFEMSALPPIAFHIHRKFISGFLSDAHLAAGEITSEG
jgi:8-oxo-dGTP pyrophosphatase MutT (NUDIX family)